MNNNLQDQARYLGLIKQQRNQERAQNPMSNLSTIQEPEQRSIIFGIEGNYYILMPSIYVGLPLPKQQRLFSLTITTLNNKPFLHKFKQNKSRLPYLPYLYLIIPFPYIYQTHWYQFKVITPYKQILISPMNKNESDQSQNEGFHVNQPCIDSRNIKEEAKQQKNNKTFEPRYITGCGVLRKQPKECLQIVTDIPIRQKSLNYRPVEKHSLQEIPQKSAFQLYNNPNQYTMVYARYKQPLTSGEKSAFQNQINLKFFEHTKEDTFKTLREFDQKSVILESAENCLIFDSKFQCGNLLSAFRSKKNLNQYTLFMQNDTNTYGYNQWFYFSIRNAKKKTRYTLKIANYRKPYSFFKMGMKPLIFSLKKAREDKEGNGWYRDSSSISYYKSNFTEIGCTPYYTLEITLQFQYDHDYITISPYAPYSYSRLIKSLDQFQKTAKDNGLSWKTKAIASSLTNTQVPFITIAKDPSRGSQKQNIVIIARQHAGETWSSFLVEEIMKDIVEQKTQYSKWLVQNYVLRIFPMVNVDGVIYGNFRCDLAGYDLNRTWKDPFQTIHPQVFAIKAELEKLNNKNGINLCLDLHTHSKEYGAFAYCCVQSQKCRQFPSILSKMTPLFRYPACTFGISTQKQSTARASIFHLTKNVNIITIQLSGYGFRSKKSPQPHMFSPYHIRIIARAILQGYHCYTSKKEPQVLNVKVEGSIIIQPFQFESSNVQNDSGPITGSDSEPEADEIQLKVRIEKVFPQQFIEDIFINGGKKTKKNSKNIKSNVQAKQDRLERIPPKKHKTPQLGPKTKSNKTQSKHPQTYNSKDSIEDTIVVTPSPSNKQPKIQPPKFQQSLYKKTGKLTAQKSMKVQPERPTKPLNLIQFSLKKLPLVREDKIKPNMNYVLQQSFPLVGGFSYVQKEQSNRFDKTFSTYEAMCRPRVRTNSRKVGFSKQKNHKLEQELPYLCVMSQNKRLLHYQHIKEKLGQAQFQPRDTRTFHNSILNGHNRHKNPANKLKHSHKYQNGDLISRINDQFARYDEFLNTKRHRN